MLPFFLKQIWIADYCNCRFSFGASGYCMTAG